MIWMFYLVCMYVYLWLFIFSLFFFFKQKTAYEMRISDWSSDVCSSDLEELRRRLGVPEGSFKNFAEFRRDVLAKSKSEIDQLADFTVEWEEIRGAGQIGRASCRERVCQYV